MAAPGPRYPKEEFQRRGDAIYLELVRPKLSKKDVGKFAAIDIETGEFEVSASELKACDKLHKRIPDAQIWMVRVGYRAVHSFGGGSVERWGMPPLSGDGGDDSRQHEMDPELGTRSTIMATTGPRYPKEEFRRRGNAIYLEEVRPKLTKKDVGKFAAIDIETGAYAVDADEMKAGDKLLKRIPDAQIWVVRVGYRAARRFGGRDERWGTP